MTATGKQKTTDAQDDVTAPDRFKSRDSGQMYPAVRQVEIIFFSMPTPAASARSYSSGTVAES